MRGGDKEISEIRSTSEYKIRRGEVDSETTKEDGNKTDQRSGRNYRDQGGVF